MKMRKVTGTASSMPKGILLATVIGLLLTLLGTSIIALLIDKEIMDESKIGYSIMIMIIFISYISSLVAWIRIKHRRLFVCIGAAISYYVLLLSITALFFGGQYNAVLETAMLVICGSLLAAMPVKRRKKSVYYKNAGNTYR